MHMGSYTQIKRMQLLGYRIMVIWTQSVYISPYTGKNMYS